MPMTPGQAAAVLAALPINETLAMSLRAESDRLAEAVRARLAASPGGPHDEPWRQTGSLQASIEASADGLSAQVGSSDPAAAPQELGTAHLPPRPFLGPAASERAEPIANEIGRALSDLLARHLS